MARGLERGWSTAQRGLAIALSVACIGLAAIIDFEWDTPLIAPSPAPTDAGASARKIADDTTRFTLPPIKTYSAVVDRPLFSEDRRPPPRSASASARPWSSLSLVGIVIAPGSREALIRHGTPAVIAHLRAGQEVDGWEVRSILSDRVVLTARGERHELRLFGKKGAASESQETRRPERR